MSIPNIPVWPFLLVSSFIAVCVPIYIAKSNRRRSAVKEFRTAFLAEVGSIINETWSAETVTIINNAIPAQEIAINWFSGCLKFRKSGFTNAWEQYKEYCKNINFEQYRLSRRYKNTDNGPLPHPKEEYFVHLNRVLKYAKQT